MEKTKVKSLIPHRDPFLFVDRIISSDDKSIETEKYIPENLDVFDGHYPENPVMPGVLLCEISFQSGALLMAGQLSDRQDSRVPVLTRIENAKFKRMVQPGDTVTCKVTIKETLAGVTFFKGKLFVNSKVAVIVDFACSLAPSSS